MKVKEKMHDDVAVLALSGNLMGGPETQELHQHVTDLVSNNITKVIIDLSNVKWMNSTGIGVLMSSFTTVAKKGGNLKLVGVADKIKSLLVITQLISFFETHETLDRALGSFKY
jgi:anti-sigma B factor antagonist